MNYGLCPHGLIIAAQCDLCSREAAHRRVPALVIVDLGVPASDLHHSPQPVQAQPRTLSHAARKTLLEALNMLEDEAEGELDLARDDDDGEDDGQTVAQEVANLERIKEARKELEALP